VEVLKIFQEVPNFFLGVLDLSLVPSPTVSFIIPMLDFVLARKFKIFFGRFEP
jgi:hypothetical protein